MKGLFRFKSFLISLSLPALLVEILFPTIKNRQDEPIDPEKGIQ